MKTNQIGAEFDPTADIFTVSNKNVVYKNYVTEIGSNCEQQACCLPAGHGKTWY